MNRQAHRSGRGTLFNAVGLAVLVFAGMATIPSCSSTKTAVGEGLLTGVTGQDTYRDTLELSLTDTAAVAYRNFGVQFPNGSSSVLLVGTANDLSATVLLRFSRLISWTEVHADDEAEEFTLDTLVFTPIRNGSVSTAGSPLPIGKRTASRPAAFHRRSRR